MFFKKRFQLKITVGSESLNSVLEFNQPSIKTKKKWSKHVCI